MNESETRMREAAKTLLESGEVAVVIGYGAGSMPFKTTPVFITKPEDVEKLVWNEACTNNLAVYLPKMAKTEKIAIVAKPCDTKSIVTLLQEKQVKRENLTIIGMNCSGVVEANQTPKAACIYCGQRTPVISDITLGEAVDPGQVQEYVDGTGDTPEERREYWAKQFEKCIRCYACRQTCPSCYCHTCFADRDDMKWLSKRARGEEAWMFHATRSMHLAGRCISCGECTRVCPVGIPVMKLTKELERHVKEMWDFEAGADPEQQPVLGSFKPEDADPQGH